MQCGSAKKPGKICYGRITQSDKYSYPCILNVEFSISITTTHLWESNYSEYQQYLFERIRDYLDGILTPIGYRKISKILNDEGLLTPRGTPFTNTKVFSIYKKGKIRLERMNRPDIVEVSDVIIEVIKR